MTSICSWMEDVGVGQRAASFPPGNMVHIDVVQNAESLGEKPVQVPMWFWDRPTCGF